LQTKLQEKINIINLNKPTNDDIRLMFIGIITEACEALENTNWKPWKKQSQLNIQNFQKEIIDLWHFVINLTIISGLNSETLYNNFLEKNIINKKRQDNEY
jgi:dimeric dUTPase (all-alpha-NTP-PPase superfamily)